MKKFKKFSTEKIIMLSLSILILILILATSRGARAVLFVGSFIVLNVFATLYKRYFYLPVEFEVISLGIVLCSISYGLIAGLIVAILGGIVYTIFCTSFSPFTIPMILGYCLMAVLGVILPISNIIYIGIIANVIHNIFTFSMYHFAFQYDISKNLLYSGTNILFNIFLFGNFAPILLQIMR